MHHSECHEAKPKNSSLGLLLFKIICQQDDFETSLQHLKQSKITHGSARVEPSFIDRIGDPRTIPYGPTDGNYPGFGKSPKGHG